MPQSIKITVDNSTKEKTNDKNESFVVPARPAFTGNIFYPGAGFDGGYENDLEVRLKEVGLANVHVDKSGVNNAQSSGAMMDVAAVLLLNDLFQGICNEAKDLKHVLRFPSGGPQFNLIGYSYGGLVAAINAMHYTRITGDEVDHLVLIATPILTKNLAMVQANSKIKKVIIHDLIEHGDVLRTGVPNRNDLKVAFAKISVTYVSDYGEKHFYYGRMDEIGIARRKNLANFLYSQGLR